MKGKLGLGLFKSGRYTAFGLGAMGDVRDNHLTFRDGHNPRLYEVDSRESTGTLLNHCAVSVVALLLQLQHYVI